MPTRNLVDQLSSNIRGQQSVRFRLAGDAEGGQLSQYKRVSRYLSGETSHKRTSGPESLPVSPSSARKVLARDNRGRLIYADAIVLH
jgi:hypothetical protein